MTSINLSVYIPLFYTSAQKYLRSLKKNLFLLNKNPSDKNTLFEIFRIFHSLKSQSIALGFVNTGQFSRLLEKCFQQLKDGQRLYDDSLAVALQDCINIIENAVKIIKQTKKEPDLTKEIENIKKKLSIDFTN